MLGPLGDAVMSRVVPRPGRPRPRRRLRVRHHHRRPGAARRTDRPGDRASTPNTAFLAEARAATVPRRGHQPGAGRVRGGRRRSATRSSPRRHDIVYSRLGRHVLRRAGRRLRPPPTGAAPRRSARLRVLAHAWRRTRGSPRPRQAATADGAAAAAGRRPTRPVRLRPGERRPHLGAARRGRLRRRRDRPARPTAARRARRRRRSRRVLPAAAPHGVADVRARPPPARPPAGRPAGGRGAPPRTRRHPDGLGQLGRAGAAERRVAGTPATVALTRAGVPFRIHEYDHAVTHGWGAEAAAALGLDPEPGCSRPSLVVADGPVVAVVPGERAARPQGAGRRLRRQAGGARWTPRRRSAGRATSSAASARSARSSGRRPVLDSSALAHPTMFVSGGRRGLELEVAPADLVRVLDARTAAIGA